MEPLDVVLWMPVVVSAVEVFEPALTLVLDSFLQNQSKETKFQSSQNPFTAATSKADSACNVTLNADLLPLIFLNMRDLRVFVPSDGAFESCFQQQSEDSKAACSYDMMLFHLQTVGASPHPDNPNSRLVLQKDMFEKFRKFGRGTRQALGFVFLLSSFWDTKRHPPSPPPPPPPPHPDHHHHHPQELFFLVSLSNAEYSPTLS